MTKVILGHHSCYDESYRLKMLSEYFESGMSMYSFANKHGLSRATFFRWSKMYCSEKVSLPLQQGTSIDNAMANRSKDSYKEENAQLKKRIRDLEKALEFSRLETQARDMMIDKAEEYFDIPIRKKSGAK